MKPNCETSGQSSCQSMQGSKGPDDCLKAVAGADCPIEGAVGMWSQAFGQAMHDVQVDILKAKIVKAWGPMMEQAADAMLETMGALWETKIAEVRTAQARDTFKQRLRDLWLQTH